MQEWPRGMRASLKLGPSFLIHVETAKGVNSTIMKPWQLFSKLRTRFVRVWRSLTAILYLKESARVFWPAIFVRRVMAAYAWSMLMYAGPSTHAQGGRHNRIPIPIWSVIPSLRPFLMIPTTKRILKEQLSSNFKHQGPRKIKLHENKYNYPHEL